MRRLETKANWTRLWRSESIHVNLGGEERWSKKDVYAKDTKRLKRLGIDSNDIEKVKKAFEKYQSGYMQFHRFVHFFARDIETVQRWSNAKTISSGFIRLSNVFFRKTRAQALAKLSELQVLRELFNKREIIQYQAPFRGRAVPNIPSRSLLGKFKQGERNATFKIENFFKFEKALVYSISKKTGSSSKVYKFVLLKKKEDKLLINISRDSTEELNKILWFLSKKLSAPISRLKETPNLSRFINFIKTGNSDSFALFSSDFINQECRISISPQYGRPSNITQHPAYISILPESDIETLESIIKLRVSNPSILGSTHINLGFLSYKNQDIIGGMKVVLDAKGVSISKRELVRNLFKNDFGFQLDIPLVIEVEPKEIYKKYLYNPPKKKKRIEIVSDESIEIANRLSLYKLLPQPKQLEETAKKCTYHGCQNKFRDQWTSNKICSCGNLLWEGGSTIVTQVIDEQNVRGFINKICLENGYTVSVLSRDLVRRKIYPIEIRKNDRALCFVPVTTSLKDDQLEALKYRFPDLVIITSKSDKNNLVEKGFIVEELYSLVYELFERPEAKLDGLLNLVNSNRTSNIDRLSNNSASRIVNDNWYVDKKSLGPEFFEADITMLLNYVFKNSIWLGAKRRGQALPDSVSAFPIGEINRGCFISDVKFTENITANIGANDKNSKYIKDGKNNQSINNAGGLKGFVFVSNKAAPSNFASKMATVVGQKLIKVGFLTKGQILSVYRHFRLWEHELQMDQRKMELFLNSMDSIFLTPSSYRKRDKILVWSDTEIERILNQNEFEYRKLGTSGLNV